MALRIYNTLTHEKELFAPLQSGKVGIYLCGPTVYKSSHIGHAVGPIIFDAIKRYLVHRGFEVTWIVNITDVEDKIILEAKAQNCTSMELAERITAEYLASMKRLNVTGIDRMPKASEHIGDIIGFVEALIAKEAAYETGGDVYFDVDVDDDYGKLSNRSTEDQAGQREIVSGQKKNPGDFALWKSAKPEEPAELKYDSPWGPGRPGWHIECSVMSIQMLGETFDIHGGGLDLIFPHHENEVAQSETMTGKPFAKYWMHHGLTRFNTKKVSKSDPAMQEALQAMNLTSLLEEYGGELLRYFVLCTHYRRPIEYSPAEIESRRKGLNTFYRLFERIERATGLSAHGDSPTIQELQEQAQLGEAAEFGKAVLEFRVRFIEAMDDDFNTAAAIGVLFELANTVNRFIEENQVESGESANAKPVALAAGRELVELGRLLGLFIEAPQRQRGVGDGLLDSVISVAVEVRQAAKGNQDFTTADGIRDSLTAVGVTLEDRAEGAEWRVESSNAETLDSTVQLLVEARKAAKGNKDFATADLIRDRLAAIGVTLEDRSDGTAWRAE